MTNFRLLQTERVCRRQFFKFDENGRKLSTVEKGQIACNKQFLLFPQCFQKACFPEASKGLIVWEWVNNWGHIMAVSDAYVFPGFLTPVLTLLFFQSHGPLFSHALAEARGKKTWERQFASTVLRTHKHQVMSQTCSPLSYLGRAYYKGSKTKTRIQIYILLLIKIIIHVQ